MEKAYGIWADSINKSYGKRQVLYEVSLAIPEGKIYGLLGPSGCGKTTLVKIISGILTPDKGTVMVNNQRMPSLEIMGQIGYMAQAAALYPTLTGYENLKFFGRLYGLKGKELNERISHVAALVNLTDDLQRRADNYSGGMKQRLSLGIALLPNPKVLILDEPTVGIDPLLRQDIWSELYSLSEQGVTILVTTHVMDEAERCHELAMMRNGQILATGTAAELKHTAGADTFDEAFIFFSNAKRGGVNE
ncbi:ABC transporter ATP-binding protein [Konateibacter massiliensis]|uniref:ABC transporter ATP-binding protein n=1 Tax=Konateibacter massiliensis TaxID=2002841 RepID=UPI000C145DE7|nr:ABC transporter ATP-binding protein [Konateibacter massiliensis]